MLAYLVAGAVVGWLVWQLRHAPGGPPLGVQVVVGAVACGLIGVLVNLLAGDDFMAVRPWPFTIAVVTGFVVVALVQTRPGRLGRT